MAQVHAEVHRYLLIPGFIGDRGDLRFPEMSSPTGLVSFNADSGIGMVICGTDTGPIDLAVVDPAGQDFDAWSEVAEVTVQLPDALKVSRASSWEPFGPVLAGPGLWRIRVCARGRDEAAAAGMFVSEAIEAHELSAWPVQTREPPALLRTADEYGAIFGRRPTPSTRKRPPPT